MGGTSVQTVCMWGDTRLFMRWTRSPSTPAQMRPQLSHSIALDEEAAAAAAGSSRGASAVEGTHGRRRARERMGWREAGLGMGERKSDCAFGQVLSSERLLGLPEKGRNPS